MAEFISKIQYEVKRGPELIDASVNQLAQAKGILTNIEKNLGDTSPVKIKPFSNEPLLIIKKEDPSGNPTILAHPARFSPEDKYSRERITLKKRFGLLLPQQPLIAC